MHQSLQGSGEKAPRQRMAPHFTDAGHCKALGTRGSTEAHACGPTDRMASHQQRFLHAVKGAGRVRRKVETS
jgi:hypothetical protein